jgi:protein TonB
MTMASDFSAGRSTQNATAGEPGAVMRWLLAGVVVLGAHAAGTLLLQRMQPLGAPPGADIPAIMIDLSPLPVAPEAPPEELPPAPQLMEAQPEPVVEPGPEAKVEPLPPEPLPEPVRQPLPEPVVEPLPPIPEPVVDSTPPPLPEPVIDVPLPVLPPPPDFTAFLPPPPPPVQPPVQSPRVERPRPRVERPVERPRRPDPPRPRPPQREAAAPPRAAAPAASAAAPSQGQSAPVVSVASWRGTLVAHLNRFKRFPPGGSTGVATVAFTIDRAGRVVGASLVGSSGDAALDAEAVSMVRRASPVPAPPAGVGGGSISLTVPVRFNR